MKFGLIGSNIGYSKSKEIFESKGIEYHVYDVSCVEQGLELAIADKLDGFNVTKPFKKDIVKYMDSLMPEAQRIGTVNCVKILNDCFVGENFDGEAFRISLEYYVDNHDDPPGDSNTQSMLRNTDPRSTANRRVCNYRATPKRKITKLHLTEG